MRVGPNRASKRHIIRDAAEKGINADAALPGDGDGAPAGVSSFAVTGDVGNGAACRAKFIIIQIRDINHVWFSWESNTKDQKLQDLSHITQ